MGRSVIYIKAPKTQENRLSSLWAQEAPGSGLRVTHNQGISFWKPTNESCAEASATSCLQLPGAWRTHWNLTSAGLLTLLPPLKGLCHLFPRAASRTEGSLLLYSLKARQTLGSRKVRKRLHSAHFGQDQLPWLSEKWKHKDYTTHFLRHSPLIAHRLNTQF